jgi:hypothetical protein
MELEAIAGIELLFPSGTSGESLPAFAAIKRKRRSWNRSIAWINFLGPGIKGSILRARPIQ